jgi:anaerobic magnesium-protoporphyrin IX monomethyl ester cyclase
VMGGPQLQEQERQVFDRLPELDIVVFGEGEVAFAEIVRQLAAGTRDWSAAPGILARSANGVVVDTSMNRVRTPFAEIASPYLEGVITGQHPNLFFETYRGCPYTCAFCAWGGDEGPKADVLPLDRIRAELDVARAMGARTLGFFDSNFNQPVRRAEQIFDMILEDDQFQTVGMSVFAQTLLEPLAQKMSRRSTLIGCGLQTSDADVNTIMHRPFRHQKMDRGVGYMKQNGLQFVIQVIVGLPGDSLPTLRSTLEYAMALEPPTIDAFRLMVLPGTEYRRRAAEFGTVFESRPFHHVISHNTMSAAEINRAERMAQALTLFYNLETTRAEMFRQARENDGEAVIDFAQAIGNFMDVFNLFDREELRKGDLVRRKQEPELMEILRDFQRFRHDLSVEQEILRKKTEASKRTPGDSYIPVAVGF